VKECIEWTGSFGTHGYGVLGGHRGELAHRKAWSEANGPIPKGMCICHTCDNRACVNPDHLFLGTIADNNRDMRNKGRGGSGPPFPSGAGHPNSRHSDFLVNEVRMAASSGLYRTYREVARLYDVSDDQVGRWVRRQVRCG